jgi:hypothetical protein
MASEDCGRDNGDGDAGVEKSRDNCPGRQEACRNCKVFARVGMTFSCFKANRDVWFRAISSTLFQYRL